MKRITRKEDYELIAVNDASVNEGIIVRNNMGFYIGTVNQDENMYVIRSAGGEVMYPEAHSLEQLMKDNSALLFYQLPVPNVSTVIKQLVLDDLEAIPVDKVVVSKGVLVFNANNLKGLVVVQTAIDTASYMVVDFTGAFIGTRQSSLENLMNVWDKYTFYQL